MSCLIPSTEQLMSHYNVNEWHGRSRCCRVRKKYMDWELLVLASAFVELLVFGQWVWVSCIRLRFRRASYAKPLRVLPAVYANHLHKTSTVPGSMAVQAVYVVMCVEGLSTAPRLYLCESCQRRTLISRDISWSMGDQFQCQQ